MTAKRDFYRRPEIAAAYEEQRFGGASGAYVDAREWRLARSLLPRTCLVAGIGCGTGRLLPRLRRRAERVIGIDASLPMLAVARAHGADDSLLAQGDAFRLPLATSSCDAVVSLRFLFHFADLALLLGELRRITRPGGRLVCDTATWSPRSLVSLDRRRWGDRVATIAPERFRALASATGWRVRAERSAFLVSPYLYRRLPLPAARALEAVEHVLPAAARCRVFWALEAV
ncbi:MAG TPA: class I SAM-dependent methyltransferase [Dehalococcoidia bacterium]